MLITFEGNVIETCSFQNLKENTAGRWSTVEMMKWSAVSHGLFLMNILRRMRWTLFSLDFEFERDYSIEKNSSLSICIRPSSIASSVEEL